MSFQQDYKLADYFSVIGLDNNIQSDYLVTKVELYIMEDQDQQLVYNQQKEKWIDLDGTNQIFLRILYGLDNPIRDINFYRIQTSQGQQNKIKIPMMYNIEPIPIRIYNASNQNDKTIIKKTKRVVDNDKMKSFFYYYGNFDLSQLLENKKRQPSEPILCMCASKFEKYDFIENIEPQILQESEQKDKKNINPPICDIDIIFGKQGKDKNDIQVQIPQGYKYVSFKLGNSQNQRILIYKQYDLLKQKFEAKVIDRYPFEQRKYYEFPQSLSQFCFPSGIELIQKDRGIPVYFSFILTDAEGQRIYGTALVFDEILSEDMKEAIRKSWVLTNLNEIYTQKAICILSHYSFMESFKEILKQLYTLHLSCTHIPIERYIVNIIDEISVPDKGNIMVIHDIGNTSIPFSRPIDQYPPYATKRDIEYLF